MTANHWWRAVVLVCVTATGATAQDAPSLPAHRVVLDAGVMWLGGYAIGDVDAQLRGPGTGATPAPVTLFSARSRVTRTAGAAIHLGFTVTPQLAVEAGAAFARPRIGMAVTGDLEGAAQDLPGEQLQQYIIDGAVVWQLPVRLGTRARPFVIAGGGYLRQLHEDRTLAETGQVYYGGVGARVWLRGGDRAARSLGLRTDLRANVRRGGIDFEDKTRVFPTLAVHLFFSL